MSSNEPEAEPWDVSLALRDVCVEMLRIHQVNGVADSATVRQWHQQLWRAAAAHNALARRCEVVVEQGATPEHLNAMKQALTRAMGQDAYWARRDRW